MTESLQVNFVHGGPEQLRAFVRDQMRTWGPVATENNVPVIENPPLARALYKSVEVDQSIPAEHFKAVAQVIGFVMRLKAKSGWRA